MEGTQEQEIIFSPQTMEWRIAKKEELDVTDVNIKEETENPGSSSENPASPNENPASSNRVNFPHSAITLEEEEVEMITADIQDIPSTSSSYLYNQAGLMHMPNQHHYQQHQEFSCVMKCPSCQVNLDFTEQQSVVYDKRTTIYENNEMNMLQYPVFIKRDYGAVEDVIAVERPVSPIPELSPEFFNGPTEILQEDPKTLNPESALFHGVNTRSRDNATKEIARTCMVEEYGHINGVEPGTIYNNIMLLNVSGVHKTSSKCCYQAEGVVSMIVDSTIDAVDEYNLLLILGFSDKKMMKETNELISALRVNYKSKLPIRIIRSGKSRKEFKTKRGYRYDGVYMVTYRTMLRRQPAYLCERKITNEENGLEDEEMNEDNALEDENMKEANALQGGTSFPNSYRQVRKIRKENNELEKVRLHRPFLRRLKNELEQISANGGNIESTIKQEDSHANTNTSGGKVSTSVQAESHEIPNDIDKSVESSIIYVESDFLQPISPETENGGKEMQDPLLTVCDDEMEHESRNGEDSVRTNNVQTEQTNGEYIIVEDPLQSSSNIQALRRGNASTNVGTSNDKPSENDAANSVNQKIINVKGDLEFNFDDKAFKFDREIIKLNNVLIKTDLNPKNKKMNNIDRFEQICSKDLHDLTIKDLSDFVDIYLGHDKQKSEALVTDNLYGFLSIVANYKLHGIANFNLKNSTIPILTNVMRDMYDKKKQIKFNSTSSINSITSQDELLPPSGANVLSLNANGDIPKTMRKGIVTTRWRKRRYRQIIPSREKISDESNTLEIESNNRLMPSRNYYTDFLQNQTTYVNISTRGIDDSIAADGRTIQTAEKINLDQWNAKPMSINNDSIELENSKGVKISPRKRKRRSDDCCGPTSDFDHFEGFNNYEADVERRDLKKRLIYRQILGIPLSVYEPRLQKTKDALSTFYNCLGVVRELDVQERRNIPTFHLLQEMIHNIVGEPTTIMEQDDE